MVLTRLDLMIPSLTCHFGFPFDKSIDVRTIPKNDIKVDAEAAAKFSAEANFNTETSSRDGHHHNLSDNEKEEECNNKALASGSVAAAPCSYNPNIIWVCLICKEKHDEEELQFCGMCGTARPAKATRPNLSEVSPSNNPRKARNHRSPVPEKQSRTRPVSTGSLRRVRSKDSSSRTPSSKRKGRIPNPTSASWDKPGNDDMLVARCIDGTEESRKSMNLAALDALNKQFDTFHKAEHPQTPSQPPKKKSIRRCQSDVGSKKSLDTSTPRSRKKKGSVPRANTIHVPNTPRKMDHVSMPSPKSRPSIRQAIPRRAKSSTTEYLEQLKQSNLVGDLDESLQSQSDHGPPRPRLTDGRPSLATAVSAGRPNLATASSGARPSIMKAASSRLLSGLNSVAKSTGLESIAKKSAEIFSNDKGNAVRLSDSDSEQNESGSITGANFKEQPALLRDFMSDVRETKSLARRPRGSSCEPQGRASDETKPPVRRPRGSSCEPQERCRKTSSSNIAKTVGRHRASLDKNAPKAPKSKDVVVDYYNDIDIDEGEDGDGILDPTLTPTRKRMPRRPTSHREPRVLAKSELTTPGKYMTPRQRLRRASVSVSAPQAIPQCMPDLDCGGEENKKETTPAPAPAVAPARIRRASLGHVQTAVPEPLPGTVAAREEDNTVLNSSAHNPRTSAGRARARGRRGSMQTNNPQLKIALAHMPEDPIHAVRGDLKQQWREQENMETLRKKAAKMSKMNKRLQGASIMREGLAEPTNEPFIHPDFSNEPGAELELASDQEDLSDMSSDGLQWSAKRI